MNLVDDHHCLPFFLNLCSRAVVYMHMLFLGGRGNPPLTEVTFGLKHYHLKGRGTLVPVRKEQTGGCSWAQIACRSPPDLLSAPPTLLSQAWPHQGSETPAWVRDLERRICFWNADCSKTGQENATEGAEPLGVKFIICGACWRVALGCGHMHAQCLHHSDAWIKLPLWFLVNKW